MNMAFLRRNKKVILSMQFIPMSHFTTVKAILNMELVSNLTTTSERLLERLTFMVDLYHIMSTTTKRSCFMIIHHTMLRSPHTQ